MRDLRRSRHKITRDSAGRLLETCTAAERSSQFLEATPLANMILPPQGKLVLATSSSNGVNSISVKNGKRENEIHMPGRRMLKRKRNLIRSPPTPKTEFLSS